MTVSVLIPTLGRPSLARTLASLATATDTPDEVIVVAQSQYDAVVAAAREVSQLNVVVIEDRGRGRGRALNVGLARVCGDFVLITDDDCVVDPGWVGRGRRMCERAPADLLTGRVLTHGDPELVPGLRPSPHPGVFKGRHSGWGKIAGCNMAARTQDLLAIGGFDEQMVPAAEDSDLGYRWLRAGGTIRYDPDLMVWHEDWRDVEGRRAVYRSYGAGQGVLYGKYLRRGDLYVALRVARDVLAGAALAGRMIRSRRREPAAAWFAGFFGGILRGLRLRRL